MTIRRVLALSVLFFASTPHAIGQVSDGAPAVDFQRDVRPILSDNCFQCHGPDQEARQANLRLDTEAGAFSERRSGPTIAPSDAAASLVFQRITHENDRRRMPPAATNKTLTAEQIDILRRWIDQGATWDQHWSFEPVERTSTPAVADDTWGANPVDRFVLARLAAKGLTPSTQAAKRTRARRVALDLTGLPPDPGTLASYLEDESDQAYETLVDKLLASRHWGEHRARYWLDAARYGDTHGIHIDNYREMYAYRDWVIQAFNENKPFDEFTVEQIAGDLLPDPSLDQLIATGFHRNNITTNEGGAIPEEFEAIYAKDRAETTASVFLSLTVGCATCHDHKFDPIAQRDFYALTAFFRNTTQYVMDGNISDPPPTVVVPSDADRSRWAELRAIAAENDVSLESRVRSVDEAFEAWLAGGEYRSIATPLEASASLMTLELDGAPSAVLEGEATPVALHDGAAVGSGPHGQPALRFPGLGWAELPPLPVDTDTPFSLAMWLYQPEGEGNFVVAGQYDPEDDSRGWAMAIIDRYMNFRLTGDAPGGGGAASIVVSPITTKRFPSGEWTHVVVTHDGTGERAGLEVYRDGEVVEQEGSEFFAAVAGSIRTDTPFLLGRGVTKDFDTDVIRDFAGGGIADLRAFDRAITAQEAKVVSLWPVLQRVRERTADALDPEERDALRQYYLALEDSEFRELQARRSEIDVEWREIRRRGSITHVMHERPDTEPQAHVLFRGLYDQPRERVAAATPGVLPPMDDAWPRNRLGLARWLVADSNPLTSRVTVNRFWQQLFGTGLVRTSEDFGAQGEPPSHPNCSIGSRPSTASRVGTRRRSSGCW